MARNIVNEVGRELAAGHAHVELAVEQLTRLILVARWVAPNCGGANMSILNKILTKI